MSARRTSEGKIISHVKSMPSIVNIVMKATAIIVKAVSKASIRKPCLERAGLSQKGRQYRSCQTQRVEHKGQ